MWDYQYELSTSFRSNLYEECIEGIRDNFMPSYELELFTELFIIALC